MNKDSLIISYEQLFNNEKIGYNYSEKEVSNFNPLKLEDFVFQNEIWWMKEYPFIFMIEN